MNISFGWTAQYLPPHGPKCVTRRLWKSSYFQTWQRAYDKDPSRLHGALNKQLCYGGSKIGTIQLTCRPYLEPLWKMPFEDLEKEGGMAKSVAEFVDRYFEGDSSQIVAVVRFKFFPNEVSP
jgi:hypothetical protein